MSRTNWFATLRAGLVDPDTWDVVVSAGLVLAVVLVWHFDFGARRTPGVTQEGSLAETWHDGKPSRRFLGEPRDALEHSCRYLLRPPLALGRVTESSQRAFGPPTLLTGSPSAL